MDEAWDLLQGAWPALHQSVKARLRDFGFDLETCIKALNHLPTYLLHRKRYPTDDYKKDGVNQKNNFAFIDTVFVAGAITFGLGRTKLRDTFESNNDDNAQRILEVFTELLDNIEHCVAAASGELARGLSRDDGADAVSGLITEIIIFSPAVAGEEWIRQYGRLLAAFDINTSTQEEAITQFADRDLLKSMVETVDRALMLLQIYFPMSRVIMAQLVLRQYNRGGQATLRG